MIKTKTKWTGFSGAPGYTNLYFRDFTADGSGDPTQAQADAAVEATFDFFYGFGDQVPNAVKWEVAGDADIVEATNGELVGNMSTPNGQNFSGRATGAAFSGPSGAVINWRTGGIRNGRRVRGRTFLVPLASAAYDTDGTLTSAALLSIRSAASTLALQTGIADLGVWTRPSGPGASDGAWFGVSSATVPDKVAILRSRRD